MPFTKTTWVDGDEPFITAAQLNRIETGIDEAHAGVVDSPTYAGRLTGLTGSSPGITPAGLGWSVTKNVTGVYVVTHSFGSSSYAVVVSPNGGGLEVRVLAVAVSSNTFTVRARDLSGAAADVSDGIYFIVKRH